MKRLLLLAALGAAVTLAPTSAHAYHHICVTSGGDKIVCGPHVVTTQPEQICVKSGTSDIICVF